MRVRASIIIWIWGLALLSPISLSAQELTLDNHLPLGRDSLIVYKLPYISNTDTGTNCVWNFSELSVDSATTIAADFFFPISEDTTHIGLHREHSNKYFHVKNDTLWQTGYETSRAFMKYSSPIKLFRFPFLLGDSIGGDFEGTGQYCHITPLSIEGENSTRADAVGCLILPGDTFRDVLRVHMHTQYLEKNCTQNWVREERYFWYSPYCRYPLIETVQILTSKEMDTVSFASSYYYPQKPHSFPSQTLAKQDNETEIIQSDSVVTNVYYFPNPVYNDVQIHYTLTRSAKIFISLHYNGGITTYQTPVYEQVEGLYSISINMSGMPRGAYVVYVHADEAILSGNLIKL